MFYCLAGLHRQGRQLDLSWLRLRGRRLDLLLLIKAASHHRIYLI